MFDSKVWYGIENQHKPERHPEPLQSPCEAEYCNARAIDWPFLLAWFLVFGGSGAVSCAVGFVIYRIIAGSWL